MMSTKLLARMLVAALALMAGRAWSANEIDDFSTNEASTSQGTLMTEGQTVDTINDNVRAAIARFAKHYRDTTGTTLLTTGSANAYAVTLNRTSTAYPGAGAPQWLLMIEANHTNTGASTINVNAIGAKSIVRPDGTALVADMIVSGRFYLLQWDQSNDRFVLLNSSHDSFQFGTGPNSIIFKRQGDIAAASALFFLISQLSTTPADGDFLGQVEFHGNSDALVSSHFAEIVAQALDVTAGTKDGALHLKTTVNDVRGIRLSMAQGVYTPSATGGDKGADTINAKDVYDDGLPLRGTPIAVIEDQKSSGIEGGTCTSGLDRTRNLNTEVFDPYSLVSVTSDQFTLPAGTWIVKWSAPAHRTRRHQSFLYDVTGAAEVKRGSSEYADDITLSESEPIAIQTRSHGIARVTPAASNVYEIRHRCERTQGTDGFGLESGFGTEVYTQVEIYAG